MSARHSVSRAKGQPIGESGRKDVRAVYQSNCSFDPLIVSRASRAAEDVVDFLAARVIDRVSQTGGHSLRQRGLKRMISGVADIAPDVGHASILRKRP